MGVFSWTGALDEGMRRLKVKPWEVVRPRLGKAVIAAPPVWIASNEQAAPECVGGRALIIARRAERSPACEVVEGLGVSAGTARKWLSRDRKGDACRRGPAPDNLAPSGPPLQADLILSKDTGFEAASGGAHR
ncbi:hypothetical protein [Albimonas donghaensis]|uniref:hypothetical protein n=1 Tax=Albimonas donghaensis TaxID=356660 RepID=UPI000A435B43|nr:hypothetical protein [Albimonas donghaensis]